MVHLVSTHGRISLTRRAGMNQVKGVPMGSDIFQRVPLNKRKWISRHRLDVYAYNVGKSCQMITHGCPASPAEEIKKSFRGHYTTPQHGSRRGTRTPITGLTVLCPTIGRS